MKKLIKYLTPGAEDINWGIFLNAAGSQTIPGLTEYPPNEHPNGYYFTWEQGRILNEYQLVYITEGGGIFENKNGAVNIKSGSMLIILPGIWHRYRPNFSTGWTENYVGFDGKVVSNFMQHSLFAPEQPIIQIGEREEIIDSFQKIFDLLEKEKPGFQQIASGLIIKLLGYLVAFNKQKEFSGKWIEEVIEDARFKIRSEVEKTFDMETFAEEHNISYSYFRRMFKKYTGLSPHQYSLQVKIIRAKELLLGTNLLVKEISYALGFESIYYFSRLFKEKTGKGPHDFRG